MRRQSVFQRFLAAIASLDLPKCLNRAANQVFHLEATAFVARLPEVAEHPFVIYADPPYSRAQYSRYYHILETLVLYDYPSISAKARYREGRFNTAFSRTAGVADAMRQFVAAAAKTGAPLYLSYPKNGLLYKAGAEPLEILLEYYPLASLAATTPLAHSTLGGAPGTAYTHVLEDLYYARWE